MDTWKTKDGRVIPLVAMSDTHLLRTIRVVEARLVDLGLQIPDGGREAMFRDFNIESASDSLKSLKKEADKRKLGDWGKFGIELVKKVLD